MNIDLVEGTEGTTTLIAVPTIRLSGRFDVTNCQEWRDCFDPLLEETGRPRTSTVAVDLSGVDFADSAALSELVRAMKHCRSAGGDLRIVGLSAAVEDIFELTGLDKAFTIERQ